MLMEGTQFGEELFDCCRWTMVLEVESHNITTVARTDGVQVESTCLFNM